MKTQTSVKRKRHPINITITPAAREALEARAAQHDISVSRLLEALAKVYCRLPITEVDRLVETDLKRAMEHGRTQAFLKAVQELLPAGFEACQRAGAKADEAVDRWTSGTGATRLGVLAFPSSAAGNMGHLLNEAMAFKREGSVTRVLVVVNDPETVTGATLTELTQIGIEVICARSGWRQG
jgi:hypothetical protein